MIAKVCFVINKNIENPKALRQTFKRSRVLSFLVVFPNIVIYSKSKPHVLYVAGISWAVDWRLGAASADRGAPDDDAGPETGPGAETSRDSGASAGPLRRLPALRALPRQRRLPRRRLRLRPGGAVGALAQAVGVAAAGAVDAARVQRRPQFGHLRRRAAAYSLLKRENEREREITSM